MSDQIGLEREVTRRRRVVLFVGMGLIGVAVRGVVQLSVSTGTRFQDRCPTSFVTESGEPVTISVPCNPQPVTVIAGWRWPVLAGVVAVIAVTVGLLWLAMRRLTIAWTRRRGGARLTGRTWRGDQVRYRLHPVQRWFLYALSVPFLVGGVLLGVLPTGAPLPIVGYFVVTGVMLAYMAGSGVATASDDGLVVRGGLRPRRWTWSQIERLDAIDGVAGPVRTQGRLLAVRTVDGRVYTSQGLASSPGSNAPSRVDQLVAELEHWRAARAAVPN